MGENSTINGDMENTPLKSDESSSVVATRQQNDLLILKDLMTKKFTNDTCTWKKEWYSDALVCRLLSRYKTVPDTHKKLVQYFDWRHKENIDEISPADPELSAVFDQCSGVNVILEDFRDRQGRPVMIVNTAGQRGNWSLTDKLYKRAMYYIEEMCRRCDETEDSRGTFTLIFNLKNWGYANIDVPFLYCYARTLGNFYMERIGVILVVNYPYGVFPMWSVGKYVLSAQVRQKFVFCGRRELNEYVDVDNMPVKLF